MQHKIEGNKLILERTFNAPTQKVWDAFTTKEIFIKWWGPRGWETEVKEFSFSEGGVNHYGMKCVDPTQGEWFEKYSWGKMVYSNIKSIDMFEYVDYFCDKDGVVQEGMPSSSTIIQFVDENGMTKIISTTTFASEEALNTVMDMGMLPGITQTWDRLEEIVIKQ